MSTGMEDWRIASALERVAKAFERIADVLETQDQRAEQVKAEMAWLTDDLKRSPQEATQ